MAAEERRDGLDRMDRPAVVRSVLSYALALGFVQVGLAILISWRPGPAQLGQLYLAVALPWTALVGIVLARNVHLLYTAADRPLNRLNLATRVTLIRVLSIPLVCALVLSGHGFIAGFVFLGAAVTDWLDGFLARRMNDVTQLGRIADPSIDAVFCGFTILALYFADRLPLWVIIMAALRYGLLLGGALAIKVYAGYVPVRATFLGRAFYFVQYCLLLLFLLMEAPMAGRVLTRALGIVQLLVSLQLLGLGRSMLMEVRNES